MHSGKADWFKKESECFKLILHPLGQKKNLYFRNFVWHKDTSLHAAWQNLIGLVGRQFYMSSRNG